jgi:hypothetical protein
MVSTAHELKDAAIKTHADLIVRVTGPQADSRYTDFFGRNATCAANFIFVRT